MIAPVTDIRGKLAEIERLHQENPLLTPEQRAWWEKYDRAVCRARAALRRAKKRCGENSMSSEVEKAEAALDRAKERKRRFVEPLVAHLWAPKKIRAVFESRWGGGGMRPGPYGVHVQTCDMVLDEVDINGPQYRTVAVVSDVGGPPTNARKPPHIMGVAWFAVADQIKRGAMIPLDEEG